MILEGLRILLFGLIGIFVVMGIIFVITFILNRSVKKDDDK